MGTQIGRGQALLARREALDALRVFTAAHALAVAAGDLSGAARAILGQAQAEFAVYQLSLAAAHAHAALDSLIALGMPQAKHAAELITQIDHYRYLQ